MVRLLLTAVVDLIIDCGEAVTDVVDLIIDCGEAVTEGCCWPDNRLW